MLDPERITQQKQGTAVNRSHAVGDSEFQKRLSQSDLGLRTLATLVELLTTLDSHADLATGANYVSQLISEILSVDRVLVFWRSDVRSRLKVDWRLA